MESRGEVFGRILKPICPHHVQWNSRANLGQFYWALLLAAETGIKQFVMGAPIRGIDIKLGKNPGGAVAARATTDSAGNFALPVLPKGYYTLTFTVPREAEAQMSVRATVRTSTDRIFDSEVRFKAKVTVAPAPIILESDGKTPFTGSIWTGPQSADSDDERERLLPIRAITPDRLRATPTPTPKAK